MIGDAGAFRVRLPDGLADAAWIWLVLRVTLGLLAVVLFVQGGLPGPCHFELARDGWTTFPPLDNQGVAFPLVGVWQRWDACWYSKIAVHGYEPGISATAFFPLLPLLMRAISVLTAGDVALAGLLINGVAFVVALTGMRQLIAMDFDPELADRSVMYLSIFPAAFFFFAPFTEAIFLACAVWALLAARRGDWELAALAGLLGSLARTQGILLALPLAWEAARALWRRWHGAGVTRPRIGLPDVAPIAAAIAPVLGFGGYVLWTAIAVGQTPFQAQSLWGFDPHWPWETVVLAWNWAIGRPDGIEAVNLAALLLFSGLFVAGIRLLPASYTLYVLPQIGIIATRVLPTPLTSTTRLVAVLFPSFVVLAMAGRSRRLNQAWIALSLVFLGVLTVMFVRGDFVA